MSLLVVGLAHQQTPVHILERASVPRDELTAQLTKILGIDGISEAFVLSTCNRVEVYAEASKFHGALTGLVGWLAQHIGVEPATLVPFLQVRYGTEVFEHAIRVASGLDSLVVGEPQVLGQFRTAYLDGIDAATVGRELHHLAQNTLRVAKRVHHELDLSDLGRNIAGVAVSLALPDADQSGRTAVVLGAGAMASLAAHSLRRKGIGRLIIVNRSLERAARLAEIVDGEALELARFDEALAQADILVTAIASTTPVVHAAQLERSLSVIDLSLPRNVSDEAANLANVAYVGLAEIRQRAGELDITVDAVAAESLIQQEVSAFEVAARGAAVAPTVTALRAKAADVVSAELVRLRGRLADVEPSTLAEVEYSISRIVDKILHTPSVRVRELASTESGETYAEALRMLFDLAQPSGEMASAAGSSVQQAIRELGVNNA